jgi:hypothetical protein
MNLIPQPLLQVFGEGELPFLDAVKRIGDARRFGCGRVQMTVPADERYGVA